MISCIKCNYKYEWNSKPFFICWGYAFKQPEFTYSACGPFTKNKEIIKKFEETGDTKHIYRNELDKACL